MRLFVCVWVPDELKEKIKKFQGEMTNLPMKAKFVEKNNLHFTVTFLGEVHDGNLPDLKRKLDESVKNIEGFGVKIEGLKVIPNDNYIRIMGIEAKNGEKIANLIKTVASSIGGKYYPKQKVTLCRVKGVLDKKVVQNFIEANREIKIGEFRVDAVHLVQSKLTKTGPIYENVHVSHLK